MPKNHPLQKVGVGERALAEKIVRLERMVRDLAQASQAADRSVEDGAIDVYDDDDNLQARLGRKKDDKWGSGYVGTAQPSRPTPPDVLAIPGGMLVFWDGRLEEASDIPIERVAIFASTVSGFKIDLEQIEDPDPDDDGAQEVGAIYSDGGGTCVIPTWGEEQIYIRAVAISESGVASDPTIQVDGYAVETEIGFYVDEYVLTEAGPQDLTLTFEPIDFSEHVYWHPGGEDSAGIFQQDLVTWTRLGQVLSLTGSPVEAQVGDLVVVKYAYLIGQPTGARIVVQIVSSDHDPGWTVELVWVDDNGDETVVEVNGANSAGPWDPQEVGFVDLADIVLRFTTPSGTYTYPNVAHFDRTALDDTDAEGDYTGHRYELRETGWETDLQEAGDEDVAIVRPSFTTASDVDPALDAYSEHSGTIRSWDITRSFISPDVYTQADAWSCAWSHTQEGDGGTHYYNNPSTQFTPYTGSLACPAPLGAVNGAVASAFDTVGWRAEANQSGSFTEVITQVYSFSSWLDFEWIADNYLPGPGNGHPDPTPPPGHTLEWEFPDVEVISVEACIAEPTSLAGSNAGAVYVRKFDGVYGSAFGPDPGNPLNWSSGRAGASPALLGPYSGGTDSWVDVTAEIEPTGKTWFVWVSEVNQDLVTPFTSAVPATAEEVRDECMVALRVTTRARRYRFVPVDAETLVLDVKAYTDLDEV